MSIENRIGPWDRLSGLRECISRKGFARILEAHSGLSGWWWKMPGPDERPGCRIRRDMGKQPHRLGH